MKDLPVEEIKDIIQELEYCLSEGATTDEEIIEEVKKSIEKVKKFLENVRESDF